EEERPALKKISQRNLSSAPAASEVRSFLRRSKDATLAFGARLAANIKLKGIGEMTELSIDTKKKRLRVRLELVGEAAPIELEITKYSLKNKSSTAQLTVEEASASRE